MVTKNLFSLAAVSAKCLCLVAALATACSLASCSDDDDDGGSDEGNPNAGLIETTAGTTLLLTSVGNIDFDYEDGKLVQMEGTYCNFTVSYYPFTITSTDDDDDDNRTLVFSDISVNGDGYITSASLSEEFGYESTYYSESSTGSVSIKCSYDGNGHLTQMTCSGSGSGKEVEDDETYSFSLSVSASATLSWSGDLLQNVSCSYNYSEKGDGYTYEEEDGGEIDYENSTSYPNTTYQYTPNTTTIWGGLLLDEDIFEALAYLGYFGKGPSYHPVSAELEEYAKDIEDGEEYYYYNNMGDPEPISYSYSLNSDGSVYYSSYGSSSKSRTYFTYSLYGVSDEDDDEVKTRASLKETSEEESPVRQRRGLFSRRHRRSAQAE